MAFNPHAHSTPQVIQGNFQGRQPAFVAQAKPAFPHAAQPKKATHVAAALQQHAPKHYTAQRQGAPQPQTAQPSRIGNAFRVPPTVSLSGPSQGRPLPDTVRQKMESFFSADFSDVRVHVGAQAQQIGAVAFTMGAQIHFAPGQYNPNTSHGQRLLGHELAHVMQQRAGRVRNPFGGGVAVVQDPGMEAEADRMGIQAAAHRVPVQAKMVVQQKPVQAPGSRPQAAHVQAAVAQPQTAQPHAHARVINTVGKPEVIQGKFPNGFAQIVRFHQQTGIVQPKTTGSAIQLAPALGSFGSGGGWPLPVLVQRKMETLFGADFNHVRIHEGPEAGTIGAKAFTRGSHIYFAPGQYNPKTEQGLQLLGHELTHVVQQRAGRVRNPFGSGVAVVQDSSMDAEADRMGAAAQMLGQAKAAPTAPIRPHQASAAGGVWRKQVIQRKVGFEFETADLIIKSPGNTVTLHEPIVRGTGWGLYLDFMPNHPAYNDQSSPYRSIGHAEFVTDAFEETKQGQAQVHEALTEIKTFVGKVAAKGGFWLLNAPTTELKDFVGGGITWDTSVASKPGRDNIVIEIRSTSVKASPQVSAGIKLGATIDLLQGMKKAGFLGRSDPKGQESLQKLYTVRSTLAIKLANLNADEDGPPDQWTPLHRKEYAGAIAQLADVITKAGVIKGIEHEKYVSALLSRTNYGDLPTFIRRYKNFKRDVLILGGVHDTPGRKLFAKSSKFSGLTVEKWLDNIIKGEDKLNWGQKKNDPRWKPQLVGSDDNRGWGTVFEFRSIGEGLPVAKWRDFALFYHSYVTEVNNMIKSDEIVGKEYGPRYEHAEWGQWQGAEDEPEFVERPRSGSLTMNIPKVETRARSKSLPPRL